MKITALLHIIGMSAALFLPIASARAQGLSLRCAPDKVVECDLGGPGTTPPGYLVLHNFSSDASDGQGPRSRLLEATDGVLYGTTVGGGPGGFGTVFRLNKDGSGYRVLHGFSIKDDEGRNPGGTLLEGTDGRLYGTTRFRGASSPGTVFAMNKDGGGYTNLHSFSTSEGDGAQPLAGVVEGPEGKLYGTTSAGGTDGVGTIFKLNKDGTGYALLRSFAATGGDGQSPWAGLTASGDGWLYGTTVAGGPDNLGTAFKVRQDGSGYVILHGFASTGDDGRNPYGNLTEGTDGWLYGTTRFGGGGGKGTVFRVRKDGTGYVRVKEFSAIAGEGGDPWNIDPVSWDAGIYGIAYIGGVDAGALVFRMGRDGSDYTILRNLPGADIDGQHPFAGLTLGRDGALYGTMESGGTGEVGTVFRLPLPCPWQFDPPTVENACNDGTNVTLSVLGTVTNGVCPQLITRTWQATDSCGGVAVCSQTVTLVGAAPLVIRTQPAEVTVTTQSSATFTVAASGSGPFSYVWMANGLPIPGATGSSHTTAPRTIEDDGTVYTVRITNECGGVTSEPARLTVVADTTPPTLALVAADCGSNQINVSFSERVDPVTAQNSANYAISGGLTVQGATLAGDGQTVSLLTGPLASGVQYTLAVIGVRDLTGNVIAADTRNSFSCSPLPPIRLFVNEWLAVNTGDLVDPADGQHHDWFELYNPSSNPIDLAGRFLTDSSAEKFKFEIPAGYRVPPGGFLLVWADGQPEQNDGTSAELHVPFTLPDGGGEISLFAADGTSLDTVFYGVQAVDVSEGRWPDGGADRYVMPHTTPNKDNPNPDPGIVECSSKGTSFWLTFPGNWLPDFSPPPLQLSLLISGCAGATGSVEIPGLGFVSSFTVPACGQAVVMLPEAAEMTTCDHVQYKGIHVLASNPVNVHGMSRRAKSADGYLAYPVTALGSEYIILAYGGNGQPFAKPGYPPAASEFAIVATQNETTVSITPAADICYYPLSKGQPYSITLNKGEVYRVEGLPDLTGSIVSADKPIAVFAGHGMAYVPDNPSTGYGDHMVEQIPPTSTWGKEYLTVPLTTRSGGDTIRILAALDGTTVTLNGGLVAPLNRGQFHEQIVTVPAQITANKPVLVAQYANGGTWDGNANADPFMMLVPATKQYVNTYCLTTPPSGLYDNHLNLTVPTAGVAGFVAANPILALTAGSFTPIGTSGFAGASAAVGAGPICLHWSQPFGVEVYGWSPHESYGYPADLCLQPVEPPTVVCPGNLTVCPGETLLPPVPVVQPDGFPLSYAWQVDFALPIVKGTTPGGITTVQNLPGLTHTFGAGPHTVTLTVSDGISPPIVCTFIVTAIDTQPPVITCAPDKTVEFGDAWAFDPPTARDECCGTNVTIIPHVVTREGLRCTQTNIMVWLATDCNGNTATCTQTVIEVDTTPPVLTCSADKIVECGTSWTFDAPTAFDAHCRDQVAISVFSTVTNGVCPATITRTWTATDCCDNRATCSQTVTVIDTTPPVFDPRCVTHRFEAGNATDDFEGSEPTAPSAGLVRRLIAEGVTCGKGFDDCAVNCHFGHTFAKLPKCISAAKLTVRLKPCGGDCRNDILNLSVTDADGVLHGGWSRNLVDLGADWCGFTDGVVLTLDLAALPLAGGGTVDGLPYLNTYGVLDIISQDDTAVDYLVLEVTACCEGTDKTVECGSAWTFDEPTASDNCSGTDVKLSVLDTVTEGSCPQKATRTWQATDRCGNQATYRQTVTVVDTTPPVFTTSCTTNRYEVGTHDSFKGPESSSPSAGVIARLAAKGLHCTKGFDECSENCFFAHTFTNLPSCITSATLTVRLKSCGTLCDTDTLGFYFTDASGEALPGAWSSLIGTASGLLGGESWCDFTEGRTFTFDLAKLPAGGGNTDLLATMNTLGFLDFIVQDDTEVDFITLEVVSCCCGSTRTVECGTPWTFLTPTAHDNCCTDVTIVPLSTVTNVLGACLQTITRTWKAIDCCGNTSVCQEVINVVDTTPPRATTPALALDVTLRCDDANANATALAVALALAPTFVDNCTAAPTLSVPTDVTTVDPACPNGYVRVRTWTSTDACGNTSLPYVQTLRVVDTTPPVFAECPSAPIPLPCNSAPTCAMVLGLGITARDVCNGVATEVMPTCSAGLVTANGNLRTQAFTLTATDGCQNSASCQVTYTWTVDCTLACCDGCVPDPNGVYPTSYDVTVIPGSNYLVNHLCRGTNHFVGDVLFNRPNGVPDGTVVNKWDPATQSFVGPNAYLQGAWSDPTMTLEPGVGFILENPSATSFKLTFSGCEPKNCPKPCPPPKGRSLVGLIGTGTATYADLFSCPIVCGTRLQRWNGSGYDTHDYVNGVWTPPLPSLNVGESVFVSVPGNPNCCVAGAELVVNGSFESPIVTDINNFEFFPSPIPGPWSGASSGSTDIELWRAPGPDIDPQDLNQHLEINGDAVDETVSQVIANLNVSCPATFSFWHVGRPSFADNSFRVELVGSGLPPVTLNPPAFANSGSWQLFTTTFVPASPTITIAFTGLNNIKGGAHIDNVSLTQCCPPVTCPPNNTLKAVLVGTNLAVTWIGTGYRLESTEAFNDAPTVWTPVSNTSPVTVPASSNQMFFRLVCP